MLSCQRVNITHFFCYGKVIGKRIVEIEQRDIFMFMLRIGLNGYVSNQTLVNTITRIG